jgi:hypothetical protein
MACLQARILDSTSERAADARDAGGDGPPGTGDAGFDGARERPALDVESVDIRRIIVAGG